MRAHYGWLHALLNRLKRPATPGLRFAVPAIDALLDRMDRATQRRSIQFDQSHGTQTYGRMDVPVNSDRANPTLWGYQAINHDFFREIMRSIPEPLQPYTFVDIGSGKGAAVFMASEFPFKALMGVELNPELVDIARDNVLRYNRANTKAIAPEWSVGDYFQWTPPDVPCLFFFNNPFPGEMNVQALRYLESLLARHPHPSILVFRKAPQSAGDYLNASKFWKPLRLAPYWRVYSTQGVTHV